MQAAGRTARRNKKGSKNGTQNEGSWRCGVGADVGQVFGLKVAMAIPSAACGSGWTASSF